MPVFHGDLSSAEFFDPTGLNHGEQGTKKGTPVRALIATAKRIALWMSIRLNRDTWCCRNPPLLTVIPPLQNTSPVVSFWRQESTKDAIGVLTAVR